MSRSAFCDCFWTSDCIAERRGFIPFWKSWKRYSSTWTMLNTEVKLYICYILLLDSEHEHCPARVLSLKFGVEVRGTRSPEARLGSALAVRSFGCFGSALSTTKPRNPSHLNCIPWGRHSASDNHEVLVPPKRFHTF